MKAQMVLILEDAQWREARKVIANGEVSEPAARALRSLLDLVQHGAPMRAELDVDAQGTMTVSWHPVPAVPAEGRQEGVNRG